MAALTGKKIRDTYKDLLQISNTNSGIDGTLRTVDDGEGTSSVLALSTAAVSINGIIYPTTDGTNGQVIVTDGAGNLSFADASGGASAINDLSDVTITSAASGDYLRYNGSAWVDVAVSQLETDINHDNLTGFVANEHIDWTSTSSNLNTAGSLKSSDVILLNGAVISFRNVGDSADDVTITHSTANLAFAGVSGAGTYSFDHNVAITGNITVSGTVDGRDIATDGTKLDGIEANATADQTTEEIQDAAWAAVSTGTQTGITVTYQDTTNDVDFVVANTTVAGDTGSTGITPGDTLTIAGGTNATTAMSGDTLTVNVDDAFLLNSGDVGTGVYDFGGATSFEIPNGTTVTTDAAGEIAMDTNGNGSTVTTGVIQGYDGTQNLYFFGATNYPSSDNDVMVYDSATNAVKWEAQSGGGGSSLPVVDTTSIVEDPVDATKEMRIDVGAVSTGTVRTLTMPDQDIDLTPGSGSFIKDIVSDTTPQLGGQLDVNGNAIGDGTRELLTFTEDASAVNHINIENEATGSGPIISAAGDDTNINLNINAKGTGNISLGNFTFDADQTVGAGQDNYVLTYDNAGGLISLEAAAGGGGNWVLISSATASGSATIDFTGLSSTYHAYAVVIEGLQPATDDAGLLMRTSTDNGATYDSSAGNYGYTVHGSQSNGGTATLGSDSATSIAICAYGAGVGIGNAANEQLSGIVYIYDPSNTNYTQVSGHVVYNNTVPRMTAANFAGERKSAADVDAIRFLMSSGNMDVGTFRLYGLSDA